MIENDVQLAATLDYIAKWADTLEGMRRHEAECNGGIFPVLAAGPLQEIRSNLDIARAFAHATGNTPAATTNAEAPGVANAA